MEQLKPGGFPEEITYDPSHDTGFEPVEVDIDGQKITIHETNNFPVFFEAYLNNQANKMPRNPLELVYFSTVSEPEKQVARIMMQFAERQPDLFREITDISFLRQLEYDARARIRMRRDIGARPDPQDVELSNPPIEETKRRRCYFSMAFDGVASIARELDPNYDTSFFCR